MIGAFGDRQRGPTRSLGCRVRQGVGAHVDLEGRQGGGVMVDKHAVKDPISQDIDGRPGHGPGCLSYRHHTDGRGKTETCQQRLSSRERIQRGGEGAQCLFDHPGGVAGHGPVCWGSRASLNTDGPYPASIESASGART